MTENIDYHVAVNNIDYKVAVNLLPLDINRIKEKMADVERELRLLALLISSIEDHGAVIYEHESGDR